MYVPQQGKLRWRSLFLSVEAARRCREGKEAVQWGGRDSGFQGLDGTLYFIVLDFRAVFWLNATVLGSVALG
ncbi:MAG TPA: hypothetical protein VGW38_00950 [Chloroflexota bacterium]|nr:hypothetical protein [Chloroflexota bacterium]